VDLIKFIAFVAVVLYPSGKLVLDRLDTGIRYWHAVIISLSLGIIVTSVVFYLSGLVNIQAAALPLMCLPAVYCLVRSRKNILQFHLPAFNWKSVLLILAASAVPVSLLVTSGPASGGNLRLIGVHAQDSLWMLALTGSIEKSIPPQNPLYYTGTVQNYHIFLNVLIASAHAFTNISNLLLYFKFVGPFLLFLFSAISYLFISRLTHSRLAGFTGTLLLTLSSNLYYLVDLIYPSAVATPSVFWVQEYLTHIVNYQLLASYIILLSWLYLFTRVDYSQLRWKKIILLGFVAGSLISFKAFASLVLLPSLGLLALVKLFRGEYGLIKIFLSTLIFSFCFYFASSPTFQSSFIIQPLWLIKTMYESSDHLNYPVWELKRLTYLQDGNYLRIGQLFTEGVAIFIFGNFGLRLLGLLAVTRKIEKKYQDVVFLIFFMILAGIAFSLLLVARGAAWNSVQFVYYSVILSSILTMYLIRDLFLKHASLFLFAFSLIWLPLIPGVIFTSDSYYRTYSTSLVPSPVYQAALFLASQPTGTVLINPRYGGSALVPAVSGQRAYFANEVMLGVQLIDYSQAINLSGKYFTEPDLPMTALEKNVNYIFTDVNDHREYSPSGYRSVYNHNGIIIYSPTPR
jgi:hypothetical protein